MVPRSLLVVTAFFLILCRPAHATATFSCEAADRNVPSLALHGHTASAEGGLLDITGVVEIEPGKKIVLDKPDVKSFLWKGTIALFIQKRIERGARLEILINTRSGNDQKSFPGTYKVSAGSKNFQGSVNCSAG